MTRHNGLAHKLQSSYIIELQKYLFSQRVRCHCNKSVFSYHVRRQRGTIPYSHAALLCAVQQPIDISCRPSHSSKPAAAPAGSDRQTDTVPFHRRGTAYYAAVR